MKLRTYVSQDTTAVALGADNIAEAISEEAAARELNLALIRNGSRGMFWLEPMIEVEVESDGEANNQRIAFGPVSVKDVSGLLDALVDNPVAHPLYRGPTEEIPYFKNQQRLTFARAGIGDPLCLDNYRALKGFQGLDRALQQSAQEIVDEIKVSGLRGRGGAAFPTGIKWQTVLDTPAQQKYIVCNADEGDSGTFADRLLMEADPYQLIEGMLIAGLAVNATHGYIYLRSEYPKAYKQLNAAITKATEAGYLGDNICQSGKPFHLQVRLGAGAYICGEETSLLDSLEGKRGMVRAKPPLPAIEGLFGKPTVVNNVLTLACVTTVLAEGANYYRDYGTGRSRGTLPIQLAGNIKRGGLVELAFGTTLSQVVEEFGGRTRSGRPIRAIQVGGPLGAYLPKSQWNMPLDYESFAANKAMLGHGGVVVFDDDVDMQAQARFAMAFCAAESCGKCTPCRIGSVRGVELIDKIASAREPEKNLILLRELCDTMEQSSLCAMGGMTPYPVRSALDYFPEDFAQGLAENNIAPSLES